MLIGHLNMKIMFDIWYDFVGGTDREDKLSADNKSVVDDYQAELVKRLGSLCSTVAASMSQQNENLQSIDKLCHSLLDNHNEVGDQIHL